jgi:bifunctional non-homologous end joining protein LigD
VSCGEDGIASFDQIRHRHLDHTVFLYAFDLIELDGEDLRRNPLEVRKATLASLIARGGAGIQLNEHIEGDGPLVFRHACKLGLEGVASKRKDSSYRSGRSPHWIKSKNPACAAVAREAYHCELVAERAYHVDVEGLLVGDKEADFHATLLSNLH